MGFADANTFPPTVDGESWDTFWAQHYVGADLLRPELEKAGVPKDHDIASLVGVWDSGFGKHGEYVCQILAGPKSSAVVPLEHPISYQNIIAMAEYWADYKIYINYQRDTYGKFYEECRQNNNCPLYLNNSMSWFNDKDTAALVSSMNALGSTVVSSAGNGGTMLTPAKASVNKTVILVSSLKPDGNPSDFTSFGDAVTVSAPSDKSLKSYDYNGNPRNFGGTSGAAPLVTGTLVSFTLLSRHHLSTPQADMLLRKTAVLLPHLPDHHLMGAGMLNSYKIGMAALRIKKRCQQYHKRYIRRPTLRKPRLRSRKKCFSDALKNDATYRFYKTASGLFEEAIKSFPECVAGEKENRDISAQEKAEAFNNLRRASFLNPTNARMWNAIACVKEQHFQGQGTVFYQSLAERVQRDDDAIKGEICWGKQALLVKYLPPSTTINLFREKKCSSKFLEVALHPLLKEYFSNELIEEILDHPNMTQKILLHLIYKIGDFYNKISNLQEFLENIIGHPHMAASALLALTNTITQFFDKISNLEILFEKIIDHDKVTETVLNVMFNKIRYELTNELPNPERLLDKIEKKRKRNK